MVPDGADVFTQVAPPIIMPYQEENAKTEDYSVSDDSYALG